MKLSENTIVITGGSSGIGLGLAVRFLKEGNKVIICGRRQERLEAIAKAHKGIEFRVCDVTNHKQRVDFTNAVLANYPDINILINNAGVQLTAELANGIDMKDVHTEIETNLVSVIHFSALFANHLAERSNSAIINVSSGLAFTPLAFMPVYCASKAALHSFSMSLRYQLKSKNVEVVELIPPAVDTELGHGHRADASQSHGGMAVSEFVDAVFTGLKQQLPEITVGQAINLREKGEAMFDSMNNR